MLGSFVGDLLLILVVISIFACGLVIMITGVRLTWAMSRDRRFPGWQQWQRISPTTQTPRNATFFLLVASEVILAVFAERSGVLFNLFSAATLLPARPVPGDGRAVRGQAPAGCRHPAGLTCGAGRRRC